MSNDLINRQETYKELIDRIEYLRDKDYELYCEIGDVIQDCIEKIPIAYDIDNVVEELELHSFEFGTDTLPAHYVRLNKAIEIVKAGGVNDD